MHWNRNTNMSDEWIHNMYILFLIVIGKRHYQQAMLNNKILTYNMNIFYISFQQTQKVLNNKPK